MPTEIVLCIEQRRITSKVRIRGGLKYHIYLLMYLCRWFRTIHPRFHTPINATIVTGAIASVITFIFDINLLSDMASIGILFQFL